MFGESRYRWIYEIKSTANWIPSLSETCNSPDVAIISESEDERLDEFFFTSLHFNDLADAAAVEDRASALKAIFDGALYVIGRSGADIKLGTLYQYPGEHRVTRPVSVDVLASPFSATHLSMKIIAQADTPNDHPVARMIFQCRTDDACREILMFIGVNGITWISLYAALDTIKYHGWNEDTIVANTSITKNDLGAFTGTANNVGLIGPLARHGERGWRTPSRTMKLDEASEMMRQVIGAFLDDRAKSAGIIP